MIIGLTGRIASGKGEVAEFLKKKGFEYCTISQKIRDTISVINFPRNIPLKREALQDFGNLIRKYEGNGAWIKRIIADVDFGQNYIIDGIRNPGEVEELKKTGNFFLISIDAPREIRYQRVLSRNKESDPKEWNEFAKIDARDFGEENPEGQQVGKCMAMADFHLTNDSTLEKFLKKIEDICNKIIQKS